MYLKIVIITGSHVDILLAFFDADSALKIEGGFEVLW
jgi:hypothetical protein